MNEAQKLNENENSITRQNPLDLLVMRVRELEKDHEPQGWPAIQMKDLSEMANAIDVGKWENGDPTNIRAAAKDALRWLDMMNIEDPNNRMRLKRAIIALEKFTHDNTSVNEVTVLRIDYDGSISAGEDGWCCDECENWNRKKDYKCRFCDA